MDRKPLLSFKLTPFAMQRKSARSDAAIHILGDEILITILDKLQDPTDRKSWCLVCKHFFLSGGQPHEESTAGAIRTTSKDFEKIPQDSIFGFISVLSDHR